MSGDSIRAYDAQIRVRSYDADTEVMHQNRAKMVAIVVDFLPFARDEAVTILDLGVGTGFLTEQVLLKCPRSRVIGVDGARAMVAMASVRLRAMAERVDFVVCDFRTLECGGGMRAQMRLVFAARDDYAMVLDLASSGERLVACQTMTMRRAH